MQCFLGLELLLVGFGSYGSFWFFWWVFGFSSEVWVCLYDFCWCIWNIFGKKTRFHVECLKVKSGFERRLAGRWTINPDCSFSLFFVFFWRVAFAKPWWLLLVKPFWSIVQPSRYESSVESLVAEPIVMWIVRADPILSGSTIPSHDMVSH